MARDIYSGEKEYGDSTNSILLGVWFWMFRTAAAVGATSEGGVSGLPYGADEQDITNVAAGPSVIVYKKSGVTLKTRTFTYTNSGASSTDVLTKTVDT